MPLFSTTKFWRQLANAFLLGLMFLQKARSEEAAATKQHSIELPPMPAAKDVVPTPLLESENYKIAEDVSISNYYYRFHVESTSYGTYDVDSLDLLQVRLFEIGVLSKANAVNGGADFTKGAKSDLSDTAKAAAKSVVTPVKSAKALGAVIEDSGRAAYDFVRLKNRNQPKDSLLTGEEKRKDAHNLGLDVYSTNPAVQAYLDQLAKSRATGSRLVDVGVSVGTFVMPFGTPVSAAIAAGKYREKLADKLDTMSPMELYRYNDKILKKMDVQSHDRENFLEYADLTPKQKTEIVADLKTLDNMPDKTPFLHACVEQHPAEGIWQIQCADILAKYNKTVDTIQWTSSAGMALNAISTNGKQLMIFPADIVCWTEELQKTIEKSNSITGVTQREFVTPAHLTERAKKEIETHGFAVRESFLIEVQPDGVKATK
ncbi:MAG TPA: hypothetical protein VKX17_28155 [Planctomycetota bacterium]|nr:hypothetical protein [Planctomycetota bacterium]